MPVTTGFNSWGTLSPRQLEQKQNARSHRCGGNSPYQTPAHGPSPGMAPSSFRETNAERIGPGPTGENRCLEAAGERVWSVSACFTSKLQRLSTQLRKSGSLYVERQVVVKSGTTLLRKWGGQTYRVIKSPNDRSVLCWFSLPLKHCPHKSYAGESHWSEPRLLEHIDNMPPPKSNIDMWPSWTTSS